MKNRVLLLAVVVLDISAAFTQQSSQRAVRKFTASGRVVNALTGEALRNPSVQLVPTTDRAKPLDANIGLAGSFEFPGLDPGKYSLVGPARNFARQAVAAHEHLS